MQTDLTYNDQKKAEPLSSVLRLRGFRASTKILCNITNAIANAGLRVR